MTKFPPGFDWKHIQEHFDEYGYRVPKNSCWLCVMTYRDVMGFDAQPKEKKE